MSAFVNIRRATSQVTVNRSTPQRSSRQQQLSCADRSEGTRPRNHILLKSHFFLFFLFFESELLVVNDASLQSKPLYRQAFAASSWNCDAPGSDSSFQSRGAAGGFKPALDPRSKICRVQRVGGKILHVANPEKSSGPRDRCAISGKHRKVTVFQR